MLGSSYTTDRRIVGGGMMMVTMVKLTVMGMAAVVMVACGGVTVGSEKGILGKSEVRSAAATLPTVAVATPPTTQKSKPDFKEVLANVRTMHVTSPDQDVWFDRTLGVVIWTPDSVNIFNAQ